MKKTTKGIIYSAALLMTCSTFSNADTHGVLLFDKTGSMTSLRWDGESRCDFGKDFVVKKIGSFVSNQKGDYLDIRAFAGKNDNTSLTEGFVDISTVTPIGSSQWRNFLNDIKSKLGQVSCSGVTALGDALCKGADSLRSRYKNGDNIMMTVVTDAGENDSSICGGGNYVEDYVKPKMKSSPVVKFDLTILDSGNVNKKAKSALNASDDLQEVTIESNGLYATSAASSLSEIEQLIQLSKDTGGTAEVIADQDTCDGDCSGPW